MLNINEAKQLIPTESEQAARALRDCDDRFAKSIQRAVLAGESEAILAGSMESDAYIRTAMEVLSSAGYTVRRGMTRNVLCVSGWGKQ